MSASFLGKGSGRMNTTSVLGATPRNASHGKYHSMRHMRALHEQLLSLLGIGGSAFLTQQQKEEKDLRLIECLRAIAELVAYGEAGDNPQFFDFFCEKGMMSTFVDIVQSPPGGQFGNPAIKTQVIQTISILVQNISSPTSLYLLLSNNHINRLISGENGCLPCDNEEFLSHYVAFLKAISVRLGPQTVQFFLDVSTDSFPLYSRAVPLVTDKDPLVRTSALTIVLHIYGVQDSGVRNFLQQEQNYLRVFGQLGALLQDTYSQLLCRVWEVRVPDMPTDALREAVGALQDLIYYLQDMLEISADPLTSKLEEYLLAKFVRPVLLESLAMAWTEEEAQGAQLALLPPPPPPPKRRRTRGRHRDRSR